jgi:hypothetical protein
MKFFDMPNGKIFKSFHGKLKTCCDIIIFKIILLNYINFKNYNVYLTLRESWVLQSHRHNCISNDDKKTNSSIKCEILFRLKQLLQANILFGTFYLKFSIYFLTLFFF